MAVNAQEAAADVLDPEMQAAARDDAAEQVAMASRSVAQAAGEAAEVPHPMATAPADSRSYVHPYRLQG